MKQLTLIALLIAMASCSNNKATTTDPNEVSIVRSSIITLKDTTTTVKELYFNSNGERTFDSSVAAQGKVFYKVHIVL